MASAVCVWTWSSIAGGPHARPGSRNAPRASDWRLLFDDAVGEAARPWRIEIY